MTSIHLGKNTQMLSALAHMRCMDILPNHVICIQQEMSADHLRAINAVLDPYICPNRFWSPFPCIFACIFSREYPWIGELVCNWYLLGSCFIKIAHFVYALNNYLLYVSGGVSLSVSLFVCLLVSNITRKVLYGLQWNFMERSGVVQGRIV